MMWETLSDRYSGLIEDRLQRTLRSLKDQAEDYHEFIHLSYSRLEEFILRRGKRLASLSTLMAYKGYTNEVDERILKVCAGIELYRHSILIHDDLVDEDEMRRGGKSFHALFQDNERLGRGTAVFMGNAVYALSLKEILNSGFGAEILKNVVELLAEGYREVNESQVLDLLFEFKEPDINEWYTMASKRAASLFRTTILTGATLGGAPGDDLNALREAASNVGYAFDIQDDIIDTFAEEQQYGRPPGGDIAKGKKPLHLIYAITLAGENEKTAIKKLLGMRKSSAAELKEVRELIRRTNGLEAAKHRSAEHAEAAKRLIRGTKMNDESKEFFYGLTDYIVHSLDWYK
jgi:geranylgeranyl pyrophosphate synthase